jgi:hypothetical protein
MEPVWLALIVTGGALLTTLLTTWLNAKQLRAGKEQDYMRQDAVAAKAAEAAQLLLAANERVARQTREASQLTNGKLNQIHELVNSTMTGQMEEAHAALAQQLVLMREVLSLNKAAGRKPSAGALEAIETIQHKVIELGEKLNIRAKVTQIANENLSKSERETNE